MGGGAEDPTKGLEGADDSGREEHCMPNCVSVFYTFAPTNCVF